VDTDVFLFKVLDMLGGQTAFEGLRVGTQFTCFTRTKVQKLMREIGICLEERQALRAQQMKIITYDYLLLNTEVLIMKELLTCGWG
jgi:hypothetical protein